MRSGLELVTFTFHQFQEFDYSELKRQAEENLNNVLDAIRNENQGFCVC